MTAVAVYPGWPWCHEQRGLLDVQVLLADAVVRAAFDLEHALALLVMNLVPNAIAELTEEIRKFEAESASLPLSFSFRQQVARL